MTGVPIPASLTCVVQRTAPVAGSSALASPASDATTIVPFTTAGAWIGLVPIVWRQTSRPDAASMATTAPSRVPRYRRPSMTVRSLGAAYAVVESQSDLPSGRVIAWTTPAPSATQARSPMASGPRMGAAPANDQRSRPSSIPSAWRSPSSLGARTRSPATAMLLLTEPVAGNVQRTTGLPTGPVTPRPARDASPRKPGQTSVDGCCRRRVAAPTPIAIATASRRATPMRRIGRLGTPTATCD